MIQVKLLFSVHQSDAGYKYCQIPLNFENEEGVRALRTLSFKKNALTESGAVGSVL